jgi:hypothetical protein
MADTRETRSPKEMTVRELVDALTDRDDDGCLLTAYERAARRQRAERAEPRLKSVRQAIEAAEQGDPARLFSAEVIAACAVFAAVIDRGVAIVRGDDFDSAEGDVFLEAVALTARTWRGLSYDVCCEWNRLVDAARKALKDEAAADV